MQTPRQAIATAIKDYRKVGRNYPALKMYATDSISVLRRLVILSPAFQKGA